MRVTHCCSSIFCQRKLNVASAGLAVLIVVVSVVAVLGLLSTTGNRMLLAEEPQMGLPGISSQAILDELSELTQSLVSQTVSAESFAQNRRSILRNASLVALLGQALTQQPAQAGLPMPGKEPQRGAEIRQVAQKLAKSENYEEAVRWARHLQNIVKSSAEPDSQLPVSDDWSGMIGLPAAMSEFNSRANLYRRALRRPTDPLAESRHSLMMALMGKAVHAEKDWVTRPEDLPQWEMLSLQMTQHFHRSAVARESDDLPRAREEFAEGMQICQQCHDKFKY